MANGDALIEDDHTSNQRRSGRVVKKREIFTPPAQKAQGGGRGKRKRTEQDADNEDENNDLEEDPVDESGEESVEDEDEPDAEEIKEKKRKAKSSKKPRVRPAAKKPKTTAPKTSVLPLRTVARKPQAKPRAARRKESSSDDVVQGLYADVFSSGHTADSTAAEWISRYQQDSTAAVRNLINLVLRAAGCTLEVTNDDIEDQDNIPGKLGDLQDEYQNQAVSEYPLISRAKTHHEFRSTLTGFFHALIATANASSLLYTDPSLIENIQVWLSTMSSSAIRPFRHTATVILLTILSTLCEVAVDVQSSLATTRRQLEGEQKKKRVNSGRVTALENKLAEENRNYETVEGIIRDIFDTVFVHRYRDVDPKIRVDCIQALGYWISTLPDLFFDGSYLRYLGWMLSDTFAQTRLEVVKQLQKLYKKKDNIGGLGTFTERFRSRLVEMATRDADPSVRSTAVELLHVIRAVGLLEPEDIDAVGKLIFDSEARVRKSVVGFFVENVNDLYESKVEDLGGEDALEEIVGRESDDALDGPKLAWLKVKCLVETLQSYDLEDVDETQNYIDRGPAGASDVLVARGVESRFSLATQSFFEEFPEVRNWENLVGYLLFDHSTTEEDTSPTREDNNVEDALKRVCNLSDKEEITLLEVLNTTVRLCLTQPEAAETKRKGKKAKNARARSLDDPETIAMRLAQLIPRLLNKFGATPTAASAVLRLEHVLNLEVFQQLRQDSTTYAALLDDINKQFVSHSNQAVLAEASAALLHARGFEDLQEITDAKLQRLWEDMTSQLYAFVADPDIRNHYIDINNRYGLPIDVLEDVCDTIRRISNLASISDCVEPLEKITSSTDGEEFEGYDAKSPLQILFELLDKGVDNHQDLDKNNDELEDALVTSAMKTILFYFMWKLRALQRLTIDEHGVSDTSIQQVRDHRDDFILKLIRIIKERNGIETLRQQATGFLLDLYTLFATLRQAGKEGNLSTDSSQSLQTLVTLVPDDQQTLVASVYRAAERAYAKKARKKIEIAEDDEPEDDEIESESEDEGDGEEAEQERRKVSLMYEQRLCELTGKIVLAILGDVLDAQGTQKGKMRERLNRNRGRLGPNFKEVVAFLDEKKPKKTKKPAPATKGKAKQTKAAVSQPVVVEDDEDDGNGEEIEEGGEEDLRNRELDPLVLADDDIEDHDGLEKPDDVPAPGTVEDDIVGD
ncbi:MAG: hypothetical protein M1816_007171 [Peltula sp. TS41687]|nr:MAG: hypothetical protein M1816_007171 [Peltula sp. TS41687]